MSEPTSSESTAATLAYPVTPADHRWRRLPPRTEGWAYAWTGAVLLIVAGILALLVLGAEDGLDASDLPINQWFYDQAHAHAALEAFGRQFQVIGSGNVTTPLALAFGVVLALFRRWRWLALFATSAIGGLLISETLKHVIARERPTWPDPFFFEKGYSFPSGHTLSGVTTWVAMGVVVLFVLPRPWSSILGVVLVGVGVAMGPSRLFLAVHWVSDVMAGWLLGFGWLLLVAGVYLTRWGPTSDDDDHDDEGG